MVVFSVLVVCVGLIVPFANGTVRQRSRVPNVVGSNAVTAYLRLRHAGLRVSIPRGFVLDTLASPLALVESMTPHSGRSVLRGSVVTLNVGCGCSLGSPGVPVGTLPRYTVPDFLGKPIRAANRWMAGKILYLTEHVGPLRAGSAANLYGNYRITAQQPSAGTLLSLGLRRMDPNGYSGGFLPTPLVIWVQRHRRAPH